MQTIAEKIEIALDCYFNGSNLYEVGGNWYNSETLKDRKYIDKCTFSAAIPFKISGLLFSNESKLTPTTYKKALKLFKVIHINTPSSYRKKPLEDLKGSIKFTKDKRRLN